VSATSARAANGIRAGVAVVVVALAVVLGGDASGGAPASAAAKLVPADALVYVHLSTDRDRPATARAAKLAERFPSWPSVRDGLIRRLSAPGCPQGADALKSADEAALALFDVGEGATANSLVLIDTGRERSGGDRRCGALRLGYVGRFLAIGQPESLRAARDLQAGRGKALADAPDYRRVLARLPEDRVADGWASRDGVRRLLAPQGGVLGAAGVLFDQPALKGAGFALSATDRGAKLVVRSVLDPKRRGTGGSGFKPFEPTLDESVPDGAMAYLGVSGLSGALARVLAAAGSDAQALAPLVGRLDRGILDVFRGEAAVLLLPAVPAPVLTIIAKADDESAARRAVARLPAAVRRAFSAEVFDGKVVVSTAPAGVRAVKDAKRSLAESPDFRAVAGGHPSRVSSLVFLDFNRLLQLGEQTGLDESKAYQRVKDDLAKVRAVGAHSSGNATESTAEISLLIP
jgi:hypothetical protein